METGYASCELGQAELAALIQCRDKIDIEELVKGKSPRSKRDRQILAERWCEAFNPIIVEEGRRKTPHDRREDSTGEATFGCLEAFGKVAAQCANIAGYTRCAMRRRVNMARVAQHIVGPSYRTVCRMKKAGEEIVWPKVESMDFSDSTLEPFGTPYVPLFDESDIIELLKSDPVRQRIAELCFDFQYETLAESNRLIALEMDMSEEEVWQSRLDIGELVCRKYNMRIGRRKPFPGRKVEKSGKNPPPRPITPELALST